MDIEVTIEQLVFMIGRKQVQLEQQAATIADLKRQLVMCREDSQLTPDQLREKYGEPK